MSKIKLETELGPIEFSTAEDAAAFFLALRSRPETAPATRRVNGSNETEEPIDVRVIHILLEAGPDGVPSTELARRLGLLGPKGLSSVGRPLTERLSRSGLAFEDAIEREKIRKSSGDGFYTLWKAKPPLRVVLEGKEVHQ